MPLVAVQNTLQPKEIPTATAMIMFGQTFGGALFLSFADTIFTNSLRSLLTTEVPGVNVGKVVNAGAYEFRKVVPRAALPGVLRVYSISVDRVFYMCVGLAGACFAFAWLMGWKDIRKKNVPSEKS